MQLESIELLPVEHALDAALAHDGRPVAHMSDHPHVMTHQNHRDGMLEFDGTKKIQYLGLHGGVESGGGLIEEQQSRRGQERARDRDSLALAAREFMGISGRDQWVEPHFRQGLHHALVRLLHAQQPQRLEQRARHRVPRVEGGVRILEHHLDFSPETAGKTPMRLRAMMQELNASVPIAVHAREYSQQRRFATTRRSDEAEDFPVGNRETQRVDDGPSALGQANAQ